MRSLALAVGLSLAIVMIPHSGADANGQAATVRADLEGRPIAIAAIPDYYCEDRDFPLIHCFTTAANLESAMTDAASTLVATAASSSDYVLIYSSPAYGGSYMYLSQNYDALWVIGWNDRISSFRALNSALGTFWSDWFATGARTDFCCNISIASLSASVDNTFSSVYRR